MHFLSIESNQFCVVFLSIFLFFCFSTNAGKGGGKIPTLDFFGSPSVKILIVLLTVHPVTKPKPLPHPRKGITMPFVERVTYKLKRKMAT